MAPRSPLRLLLLPLCVLAAQCRPGSEAGDARSLPWQFLREQEVPQTMREDLDRDGADELISWGPSHRGVDQVTLRTTNGTVIDQINFEGWVRSVGTRDLEGDGSIELYVSFVRNDSLFLTFLDDRGRKLRTLFLTTGEPRIESDGVLPWDPRIRDAILIDVDGDGRRELVLTIVTAFARMPRGVFVYSWPEGRLLGRTLVGASIAGVQYTDLDGDGIPELLIGSAATNNGAVANGIDDRNAWLLAFKLGRTPALIWSRPFGETWQIASFNYRDYDGDGRNEILAVSSNMAARTSPAEIRVELIEPLTWQTKRARSLRGSFAANLLVDRDGDGRLDILAAHTDGEILALDLDLQVRDRFRVPGPIESLRTFPDIDGDGRYETAILSGDRTTIYSYDFKPLAVLPGRYDGNLARGPGLPRLTVAVGPGGTFGYELEPNPFWRLRRWGPGAALTLAVLVGSLLLVQSWTSRRRLRLLQLADVLAGEAREEGLGVLDSHGSIRWANTTLVGWTGLRTRRFRPAPNVQALADRFPALADFCAAVVGRAPPVRRAATLTLAIDGATDRFEASAVPFHADRRGDPHWLVRLSREEPADREVVRTWMLMARSVAHGLKNPLTGVLLTLQRLQMEYRERAPAVANRLDRYTARIERGVDELRQLTSHFLKFANLETPDFQRTDLNAVVRNAVDRLRRTLPPDIRLKVRLANDLEDIEVDQEQIGLVLDNLASNAIDAMPDGGTITITTGHEKGIRFDEGRAPADYHRIEVLDTGNGVPAEIHDRIFEPGFSTRESGTGVGLAIVAKIVNDHNGHIAVEGEPDAGSAFVVHLPLRQNGVAAPAVEPAPGEASRS